MNKPVDYRIISKPVRIELECPYCKADIIVDFDNVDFIGDSWSDGGYCDCPNCEKEIKLGDWDYD